LQLLLIFLSGFSTSLAPALALALLGKAVLGEEAQQATTQGEVDSTDAGSSCSEAESGWSSASEVTQQHREQLRAPTLRRKKPAMLNKRVRLQSGKFFQGTPLTPIPGTPVRQPECHPSPEKMLASFAECRPPPGLPATPKRQARQALLERATAEGIPLKVRMPEVALQHMKVLDNSLPAKKRPIFTSEPLSLNPRLPAKKCLTPFLLEPPCLFVM